MFVFDTDSSVVEADEAELATISQELTERSCKTVLQLGENIEAQRWEEARMAAAELSFLHRLTKTVQYTNHD